MSDLERSSSDEKDNLSEDTEDTTIIGKTLISLIKKYRFLYDTNERKDDEI